MARAVLILLRPLSQRVEQPAGLGGTDERVTPCLSSLSVCLGGDAAHDIVHPRQLVVHMNRIFASLANLANLAIISHADDVCARLVAPRQVSKRKKKKKASRKRRRPVALEIRSQSPGCRKPRLARVQGTTGSGRWCFESRNRGIEDKLCWARDTSFARAGLLWLGLEANSLAWRVGCVPTFIRFSVYHHDPRNS